MFSSQRTISDRDDGQTFYVIEIKIISFHVHNFQGRMVRVLKQIVNQMNERPDYNFGIALCLCSYLWLSTWHLSYFE